jgi:putative CocE/NonD family hydrolase
MGVRYALDTRVPMRDRVELSADIYLPETSGPFPTVLIRTPYDNNKPESIAAARSFAQDGYACVLQDIRGRWDSDGTYYPFRHEGMDGYDTQQWIGEQSWCDGRIGMSGASYLGMVQWMSAPHASPSLTCLAPRVSCTELLRGLVRPGGALQLTTALTWGMQTNARTLQSIDFHNWTEAFRTLPIRDLDLAAGRRLDFWQDWLEHACYDDYWEAFSVAHRWHEIRVPAFNMGGWYDLFVRDTFLTFNALRAHGATPESRQSRLIVGPWPHRLAESTRTGDVDFGVGSLVNLDHLERRWFNQWLKDDDDGLSEEPPLRLFIMGANEWRDEHEWPLARTHWQTWYLHSSGNANSARGDGTLSLSAPGEEPADAFVYDPRFPVQSLGGTTCCNPEIVLWGPHDQRPVEARSDVLCYTTTPLREDLEITGPITLVLHSATDGRDTDWTAKLVDVSPSGYAMNLCDGIIRARYREGLTEPSLLAPGHIYRYEIDVGVTGNVFRTGHCIRIEISSSNFPCYDRNLNTGNDLATDTEMRTAVQTVLHSHTHPSHVRLPVIPRV